MLNRSANFDLVPLRGRIATVLPQALGPIGDLLGEICGDDAARIELDGYRVYGGHVQYGLGRSAGFGAAELTFTPT